MEVKIKLLENGIMPTKGTDGAAAYDLYVPEDTMIRHGRSVVKLKFMMQLPNNYKAEIEPRSGYSVNGFEGAVNGPDIRRFDCDVIHGLIDEDYRGEVGVIVRNNDEPFWVKQGSRIAQMIINKIEPTTLVSVDVLDDTSRGVGGFGSTGA